MPFITNSNPLFQQDNNKCSTVNLLETSIAVRPKATSIPSEETYLELIKFKLVIKVQRVRNPSSAREVALMGLNLYQTSMITSVKEIHLVLSHRHTLINSTLTDKIPRGKMRGIKSMGTNMYLTRPVISISRRALSKTVLGLLRGCRTMQIYTI